MHKYLRLFAVLLVLLPLAQSEAQSISSWIEDNCSSCTTLMPEKTGV
jgi:hypothetical protein